MLAGLQNVQGDVFTTYNLHKIREFKKKDESLAAGKE